MSELFIPDEKFVLEFLGVSYIKDFNTEKDYNLTGVNLKAWMSAYIELWRQSQWQSIRSAPKDGTSILVYSPKYKEQFVVQWMLNIDDIGDAHWVIGCLDGQVLIVRDASHWKPLPQPPEKE